jgi:hypothetical protein
LWNESFFSAPQLKRNSLGCDFPGEQTSLLLLVVSCAIRFRANHLFVADFTGGALCGLQLAPCQDSADGYWAELRALYLVSPTFEAVSIAA